MRRLLFCLFLTLLSGIATAQPLVIYDRYEVTGFLALNGSYTSILDQPAYTFGGSAALVIDHSTVVGIEGSGLFAGVEGPAAPDGARPDLQMFQGGMLFERIESPAASFHVITRALFGVGRLRFQHQAPD